MVWIVSVFTTGNQTVQAAVLSCHWSDHKQKINVYDCSNLNQKEVCGEYWNILITAQYVNHRHRFSKTIYHKMKSMGLSRRLIDARCAEQHAEVISAWKLTFAWLTRSDQVNWIGRGTKCISEKSSKVANSSHSRNISVSAPHYRKAKARCAVLEYLSNSCSFL